MPDYYNKAFQGGPKVGPKPNSGFKLNTPPMMGIMDPLGIGKTIMNKTPLGGVMNKMGSFASKIPGIGGLFGSEHKPSPQQMLMYNYGRVGQLQAKAEAETDPKRQARFMKKADKAKGAVEKYAYRLDQKTRPGAKFLPPRTFDEIDAGRKAYIAKMSAPAGASTRTITRTL